jgi:peptidyl-prolyl cis-trans isomerase B (cyclophilin B)
MKKLILLVLFAAFTFQVNASVIIRSNLVAYSDDATIVQADPVIDIEKEEKSISKAIANIKASLEQTESVKKTIMTIPNSVVTQTKSAIVGDAKTNTKEIIMEAQPIVEVEKEQKDHETFVVLKTEKGDVKIKLYMDKAPITAGNFLDLAKKKFYNGLSFHRLIAGFMVQGGCPLGTGTGNYVDPETKQPRYIKHESHPELKHDKEGVVAMARTSDPDTASSQFFIDLGPQPFLNAGGADPYGYAVFGQVVDGMSVVHKIMKENIAPYAGSDGSSNPVKILTVEVIE